MIATKSPFILRNFLLLKQNVEIVPPEKEDITNISEIIDSYDVDIDFTIQNSQIPFHQIFVKIEINLSDTKKSGYAIYSEGVGIFEFDKSVELTEKDIQNYLYFSGISICINSLRSIISNVTAHCPFGKYSLPSIDLTQLVNDKINKNEKKEC